jgi:hypothetical protein
MGRGGTCMLTSFLSTYLRNSNSFSFGPTKFNYQAFACYDLLDGGRQKLSEYGVWTGDTLVFFKPQPTLHIDEMLIVQIRTGCKGSRSNPPQPHTQPYRRRLSVWRSLLVCRAAEASKHPSWSFFQIHRASLCKC